FPVSVSMSAVLPAQKISRNTQANRNNHPTFHHFPKRRNSGAIPCLGGSQAFGSIRSSADWRRRSKVAIASLLSNNDPVLHPQLVSSTVMLPSIVEEQRGDQRSPAGLMACADAGAVVSVEVFMKRNVIPPVRVALEIVVVAPDGAASAA